MAFELPTGFRFGTATAGFQSEGGFNGPGEPSNNWAEWEREGRVEPSGVAVRFWDDYEEHLDRAADAGCDGFRMSVEWARCEPVEGSFDDTAFDRYRRIVVECRQRGMEPLVTLHHFTHPEWLGTDFWLQREAPERFAAWAQVAVGRLGDLVRDWVSLNEINVLAVQSYVNGIFPPGRRVDIAAAVRSLDNLVAAHVLTYDIIHRVRTDARVSTNTYALSVYELDRMVTDLLLARSYGVDRYDLRAWLQGRKDAFYASDPPVSRFEGVVRRLAAAAVPLDQALPRAVDGLYASRHPRCTDVAQIDYYNPIASNHLRVPGHRTAGGRGWLPGRYLWDDPPNPAGLTERCRLHHEQDMEVWVVENGLCNRVRRGRSWPRLDGWDRPRYLRENLAAVVRALEQGVPVTGYYHWTLTDNYEWGSYEPRFGLHGVDRERGVRLSDRDAMGRDAAGAYHRIIKGLRDGDLSVLSP